MSMVRCKAGEHFYDNEMHNECPYCKNESGKAKGGGAGESTEQNFDLPGQKHRRPSEGTKQIDPSEVGDFSGGGEGGETKMVWPGGDKKSEDGEKIESFNPPVGWFVIIDGPGKGNDLKIYNGYNSIGRDVKSRIRVDFGDDSISREKHASIIYDFESNAFFLAHDEGKTLTKLNGALVTGATPMNSYDQIKIGKTTMVFVPLCTDHFTW